MCFCTVRVFSESYAGQGASRVICPISRVDMLCRAREAGVPFHHQKKNMDCRMIVRRCPQQPHVQMCPQILQARTPRAAGVPNHMLACNSEIKRHPASSN